MAQIVTSLLLFTLYSSLSSCNQPALKETKLGKLFLLFAIMPIIEIALLINVGEMIGGWNTVGIVIITAFVGAYLVRKEGLSTLVTAQQKMQQGAMPGQEMAEGLLLVVAGVLLVTPGFVTDGIGFLLSMPLTRPLIAKALMKQMTVKMVAGQQQGQFYQQGHFHQHAQWTRPPHQDGDIIEGEYESRDEQLQRDRIDKPD